MTDAGPPGTWVEVLETLGPHALRVVAADPARLAEPVGEPVVHGPGEPLPDLDGPVLLAGARPSSPETEAALRQVAQAGGGAVVVKAHGEDLAGLVRCAQELGLSLLTTPDEMAWRHLDAMLTAARTQAATIGEGDPSWPEDLFGLANAIAASLGGPITIEETSGRVMAYSNLPGQEIDEIRRLAILGRQTPARPTNSEEYQAVVRAPGAVFFESAVAASADRMAVAIRAGHQVLGVIFVLCDRPRLVDDAERVLVDAARATALHLLRARGSHHPDRTRRGDLLRSLLAGSLDTGAAVSALGLPPHEDAVVAVVRPESRSGSRQTDAARVADLAALHAEYWHPAAASVLESDEVVLLLPVDAEEDRLDARLHKLGEDLLTAAERSTSVSLRIGFGPPTPLVGDLRHSHRLALEVLAVEDGPAVAALADVLPAVVVGRLREAPGTDDDLLLLPEVRAVLEHDAAQGTSYAETLLTYLGCFGDVAATAARLHVHENTARYRVRRLVEKFGIDLTGHDALLVTWWQLRVAADRR